MAIRTLQHDVDMLRQERHVIEQRISSCEEDRRRRCDDQAGVQRQYYDDYRSEEEEEENTHYITDITDMETTSKNPTHQCIILEEETEKTAEQQQENEEVAKAAEIAEEMQTVQKIWEGSELSTMKVADLKKLATSMSIDAKGTKDVLVARLTGCPCKPT